MSRSDALVDLDLRNFDKGKLKALNRLLCAAITRWPLHLEKPDCITLLNEGIYS